MRRTGSGSWSCPSDYYLRDFRTLKGNEVAIFKDRVEIYNPGDFPEGYTPEDFIKGEEHSIPRNPLIASVLFRTKDVEEWGSGLKRISKECAENGVKVAFKVLKSGFLVTFCRELSPSPREETRGKTRDKILFFIKRNPQLTIDRLAKLTGVSAKGVEWHIAKLKGDGRLRRSGSRKAGRWDIL